MAVALSSFVQVFFASFVCTILIICQQLEQQFLQLRIRVDAFWEASNWLKHQPRIEFGTVSCGLLYCNMQMRFPMVLVVLLIVYLSNSCAARTPVLNEEARNFFELFAAKAGKPALKAVSYSKATIDLNKGCVNDYPKLNYKPVTNVCSSKVPATKACCAAFNKFACQFRSQVNNFNTVCPIMFMSYLNYAGGYQDGYFIGPCIDGKKGMCV